tara:strand:+ start:19131 stop:19934 length:804 start_codon:yes stop_codon:yes gene_type:complete
LNSEQPIGIFDSGIGGLTIAAAINETLPNEQIIYFGDTQHLPYGDKSNKKILFYSDRIVEFLLKKKCKAIIIACNSASAIAYDFLEKKTHKKSLLFNVINPLIKYIEKDINIKNIGIIGTNATISSNVYQKSIKLTRKDINVKSLATPLLASLIEENNQKLYQKGIVETYLSDNTIKHIDTLVLGCTHYPLIESIISKYYNENVKILSSLNHIGNEVKQKLQQNKLLRFSQNKLKHNFYVSDYTSHFQQKTKLFFPSSIILKEENIF